MAVMLSLQIHSVLVVLELEDYDLQDRVREINIAAVKVAKEAIAEVKPSARVAGSMGPTGRFLQPLGNMSFGLYL